MSDFEIQKGIVLIDMDKKCIDNFYIKFPDTLRAKLNSEINFIVQIWRKNDILGVYSDGNYRIQQSYHYKMIDFRNHICLNEGEIKGPLPPENNKTNSFSFESNLWAEMQKLILIKLKK